jgi:hypothetical protein
VKPLPYFSGFLFLHARLKSFSCSTLGPINGF